VQVMHHTWFPNMPMTPRTANSCRREAGQPFLGASHMVGLRHMHCTRRSVGFGMAHLLSPTQAHNIKTGMHTASLRARAQVNVVRHVTHARTHASRMSLPIETKNNRVCFLLASKLLHDHWIQSEAHLQGVAQRAQGRDKTGFSH